MIKSAYSFRMAVSKIPEVAQRVKEIGWSHFPLADFCSSYGFGYLETECEKLGLKPIYGATIPVTAAVQTRKPIYDEFVFFAKESVASVNRLISKSYDNFRYTGLLKYSDIANHEGVIRIAGFRARLDEFEPDEDTYIGLSGACSAGYIKKALDRGFKLIATQNNTYARPEDRGFYEVLCGRDASQQTYNQYIQTDEEWLEEVTSLGFSRDAALEAIDNRNKVFAQCEGVTIPQGSVLDPKSEKTLREMCLEGAAKIGVDLTNPVYADRLDTELEIIEAKGFSNYFFIMADIMQYARSYTLVGPARGSSAGSLVAYLLSITTLDPVKYDLLFWRFIDINRNDEPDIDNDTASVDRDAIISYIVERFGREHVAQLGTIAKFQAKNTADEVCKALDIPKFEIQNVLNVLPSYAAGDDRTDGALAEALDTTSQGEAFLRKYPYFELAKNFGGHPRHSSTHAAGVLVTEEPIENYFARDTRNNTVQCDLKVAEKKNLLKIDMLGLINLSIFKDTLELAGLPRNHLDTIDLEDPRVFQVLNDGKFQGVFQLEGRAAQQYSKQITFETLDDISNISAISRPGPMQSGSADSWVRRRMSKEQVTYLHPAFEPYLKNTMGLLIMQEDLMKIARELAGLEWKEVTALRKAVGKSMGDAAMKQYSEPFIDGMEKNGIPREIGENFWKQILGFAKYGFNRSHSLSYAIVTYWSCYFKAYYPLEYAAASLSHRDKKESQVELLKEMAAEGVGYLPYDAELSSDRWRVGVKEGKKVLVGPLTLIKGLGVKKVQMILGARARNEPLPDSIQKLLANAKTEIDSLSPIRDAILTMNWRAAVNGPVTRLDQALPQDGWAEYNILGLVSSVEDTDENAPRKQEDRKSRGQEPVLPGNPRSWAIRIDSDETKGWFAKVTTKKYEEFRDQVLTLVPGKTIVALNVSVVPSIPCGIVKSLTVVGEVD